MAYIKKIWKDYPDTTTPIKAEDLNNIENGIEAVDTALNSGLLNFFYPVGTIYATTSTDLDTTAKMAAHFGGTWERWGNGRVPVGVDTSQSEFNTVEKTGGSKELQSHKHGILVSGQGGAFAYGIQVQGTGANGNFNNLYSNNEGTGNSGNLQPYITCYMFKRTA